MDARPWSPLRRHLRLRLLHQPRLAKTAGEKPPARPQGADTGRRRIAIGFRTEQGEAGRAGAGHACEADASAALEGAQNLRNNGFESDGRRLEIVAALRWIAGQPAAILAVPTREHLGG